MFLGPEDYLRLFREAQQTEFGLRIPIEPELVRRFEKEMYAVRKDFPDLQNIQLSYVGDEIWLVKDTVREILDGTVGRTGQKDKP